MFKVSDKMGQEIYLKDKVSYLTEDSMGAQVSGIGYVICLPTETTVQVQPEGGDTPVIMDSLTVTVIQSLIQDIGKLKDSTEFQAYIAKIEERYETLVKQPKGRAGAKAKQVAKPVVVNLGLNLGDLS